MERFREYLNTPWRLEQDLADMDLRLQELWAVCTKRSTNLNQVGGRGGGGGDAKDGSLAAYSDFVRARDRVQRQLDDADDALLEFLQNLERSGRPHCIRDAKILLYRYAVRLDWKFIYARLAEQGYPCQTLRTVFNWHAGALERAGELWEETHGNQEST